MKDKGILFWVKRMEIQIALFFGISIVYSLILFTSNNPDITLLQRMFEGTLYYAIIFGVVTVMIFQTTNLLTILPLAISMGNTRKGAVLGMQVLPIGGAVEYLLFYVILSLLAYGKEEFHPDGLLVYAGLLLISAGIGQLLNCIHIKTGEKKGVYYVVLVIGFLISMSMGMGYLAPIFYDYTPSHTFANDFVLTLYMVGAALCAIGLVLYGISFVVFRSVMKNYEVKM